MKKKDRGNIALFEALEVDKKPKEDFKTETLIFPFTLYGFESWIGKKADRNKMDSFQRWCWRRALGTVSYTHLTLPTKA